MMYLTMTAAAAATDVCVCVRTHMCQEAEGGEQEGGGRKGRVGNKQAWTPWDGGDVCVPLYLEHKKPWCCSD